jgi:hypothetical protein
MTLVPSSVWQQQQRSLQQESAVSRFLLGSRVSRADVGCGVHGQVSCAAGVIRQVHRELPGGVKGIFRGQTPSLGEITWRRTRDAGAGAAGPRT